MSIDIKHMSFDHWELAEAIQIGKAKVKHVLAFPSPHRLDDRSLVSVHPVVVYGAHGENVTALARPLPEFIDIGKLEGWFVETVRFVRET